MKLTMMLLQTIIVFWNVENFFDYHSTSEISSCSWTASRFYRKAEGIGKVILSLSDSCGRAPDIVGLCEIDSPASLKAIVHSPVLEKQGYRYVHYESADHRGIDCALLYRGGPPLSSESIPITLDGEVVPTRSLLRVDFDSLSVMVVHLPSKRGGSRQAQRRRARALAMIDSVAAEIQRPLVVMGDFNEEAGAEGARELAYLKEILPSGEGSIKFNGRWEKIDRCLVKNAQARCEIAFLSFLLTEDKNYGGLKPLRTNSGPRYLGGLSDHLPLRIEFYSGSTLAPSEMMTSYTLGSRPNLSLY
ncbi:MAG: endonuclease/exonuclease/phosphatase family protein [Candidatus Cryptobacteroides sp.]